MLKALFPKLRIVARDNVIRVLGDEEQMAVFEETVENMRRHVLMYNSINEENILDIAKGRKTKEDSVKGVIVYNISGKPIKSRSANQQELVDAYDRTDMIFGRHWQDVSQHCTCRKGTERETGKENHT